VMMFISVSAARIWNSLRDDVVVVSSVDSFQHPLSDPAIIQHFF